MIAFLEDGNRNDKPLSVTCNVSHTLQENLSIPRSGIAISPSANVSAPSQRQSVQLFEPEVGEIEYKIWEIVLYALS